jgi:hypothetical protein
MGERNITVGLALLAPLCTVQLCSAPNSEEVAFGSSAGYFSFPDCCPSTPRSAAGCTEVFSDQ